MVGKCFGKFVEPAMARAESMALCVESSHRCSERIGVLVDTEDVEVRMGRQDGFGVAAAPESRVDEGACWHIGEQLRDLSEHHRLVVESFGCAHCCAPVAIASPVSSSVPLAQCTS